MTCQNKNYIGLARKSGAIRKVNNLKLTLYTKKIADLRISFDGNNSNRS